MPMHRSTKRELDRMVARAEAAMAEGSESSVRWAEETLDEASLLVADECGSFSVEHLLSICDHAAMQVAYDFRDEAVETIRDHDLDEAVWGFVNGGGLAYTPGAQGLVRRYTALLRSLGDADGARRLRAAAASAVRQRSPAQ